MANYNNSDQKKGTWNKGNFNGEQNSPTSFIKEHPFRNNWITEEADGELVAFAEKAGEYMAKNGLTNSKIRSVYSEIKRIQVGGFSKNISSFYLLKPKMAYAVGREPKNNGLKLFQEIFNLSFEQVGKEEKNYKNLCNLIEAVLAYHKAYGGKD